MILCKHVSRQNLCLTRVNLTLYNPFLSHISICNEAFRNWEGACNDFDVSTHMIEEAKLVMEKLVKLLRERRTQVIAIVAVQ